MHSITIRFSPEQALDMTALLLVGGGMFTMAILYVLDFSFWESPFALTIKVKVGFLDALST